MRPGYHFHAKLFTPCRQQPAGTTICVSHKYLLILAPRSLNRALYSIRNFFRPQVQISWQACKFHVLPVVQLNERQHLTGQRTTGDDQGLH